MSRWREIRSPFSAAGLPSTSVPGQPSAAGARAPRQARWGSHPHSSQGLSRGDTEAWRDFVSEGYCAGNEESRPAWVQVLDVEMGAFPPLGRVSSALLGCSQGGFFIFSHPFPPRGRGGSAGPTQVFTTARWVVRGCGLCRGPAQRGGWVVTQPAPAHREPAPTLRVFSHSSPSCPIPAHLLAFPAEAGSRACTGPHPIAEPPSSWGQSAGSLRARMEGGQLLPGCPP